MEKKLPLICSLAALAVALLALVIVLTLPGPADWADAVPTPAPVPTPIPTLSPQDAYRLEKLNEVGDMVLHRQVIPRDYCRYLDAGVADAVNEYNAWLTSAKTVSIQYAKEWADTLRNISSEDDWFNEEGVSYSKYLEEGDNYYRFIDEFSTALLYPNRMEFALFGTVVGYPAGSESGSSAGLWASGYYMDKSCLEGLTTAATALLDKLDAARAGMAGRWVQ